MVCAKKYVVLSNKFTTYKQKEKKCFEFTSYSSNFSGDNQNGQTVS